jgi:hypothetical protein
MSSLKPTMVIHPHPEDTETILSQREALKYFKAGLSSSLSYELFAWIPIASLPGKNVPFILKYAILRISHFVAL